jgi:hypothetical protein
MLSSRQCHNLIVKFSWFFSWLFGGLVFDEMNAVRVVDAFQAPAVQSPKNKIDNLMQNC